MVLLFLFLIGFLLVMTFLAQFLLNFTMDEGRPGQAGVQ